MAVLSIDSSTPTVNGDPTPSGARRSHKVRPSVLPSEKRSGFTLDQELTVFGRWTSDPIHVPPKGYTRPMVETMLAHHDIFSSQQRRWETVFKTHGDSFAQVRQIEMREASIRLPQGRLFVHVLEQKDFDKIEDRVPACVQTRLDEFLSGPAKRLRAKVFYLKPLCVEIDDRLIFTTEAELQAAIAEIRDEVCREFRNLYLQRLPRRVATGAVNVALAAPRAVAHLYVRRQRKAIEAYQARLEFQRRRTALAATRAHHKTRTHGCTFDEMLALTNPLVTEDVVNQFGIEHELSTAKRNQMLKMATGTLPWFFALSLAAIKIAAVAATATTPVLVADPAFVTELPNRPGELLKIGHFDEVNGVTHVEI